MTEVITSRKIIQICADSYVLCALCDDGTVWHKSMALDEVTWTLLPAVPQDKI